MCVCNQLSQPLPQHIVTHSDYRQGVRTLITRGREAREGNGAENVMICFRTAATASLGHRRKQAVSCSWDFSRCESKTHLSSVLGATTLTVQLET